MHKKVLIAILVLLNCCGVAAQNQQRTDTLEKIIEESSSGNDIIEEDDTAAYAPEIYDTSLAYSKLLISTDSINSWKNNNIYGYAKYLDSLLKQRQKKDLKKQKQQQSSSRNGSSSSDGFGTMSNSDSFFASPGTRIFLWILAGIFILFVVYKLFLGDGIFKRATKTASVTDAVEEHITSETDIDGLISAAVRNGNYRLAVRYWYLKSLHHLSDRSLLQLAADKTNYQYVHELSNERQRNEFAALTLNYEYVWYGEFHVDEQLYRRLENNFSSFVKKV